LIHKGDGVQSPVKISQKLLSSIEASSSAERALIQILSIIYAPVSKNVLLNVARRFNIRTPDGRTYTGLLLAETLEKLAHAKLVSLSKEGVRCSPQILHAATLGAVRSGCFDAMVLAVQLEIPMVSEWGSSYYRSPAQAMRDVRIGFYRRDPKFAFEMLSRLERQFPYEVQLCHPFVAICNSPFDPEWFRALPEPLLVAALREILAYSLNDLLPCEGAFQVLCERAAQHAMPQDLTDLYCRELLLRGRRAEAEHAAREMSNSKQLALLGWCAMLSGAFQESSDYYDAALLRLKKETGKRKTFFDDISGPFYILALIASGNQVLLERAVEFCTFVVGKREWPHQDVYRILQLVIAERNGEREVAARLEAQILRMEGTQMVLLFLPLALHWCGSDLAKKNADALSATARQAREAGYLWLADEMDLTALASGRTSPQGQEIEARYRKEGQVPLVRMVAKTEFWENALKALTKLNRAEEAPAEKAAPQSRLIWHFQDQGRFIELQPREQKQTPGGKWTSGRNVALKRLAGETRDLDFLSEQDLRICACIKLERESGYGYYGREVHRLDLDRAIPLLIGHPQVYLDAAASVRLELSHGEPELQLSSQGETLLMTLFPPFEPDRKLYLLKESPTRIKVFQAKEEYRKISAILGSGLKIPASAKDQTLEAIKSLSSILTVHSDIGSESAELLPGDATPCFHLLPYSGGVKLEMLVRPFGDAGPYFRPGGGGETVMAELQGKRAQARRDLRLETRRAADALAALPLLADRDEHEGEWLVPDPELALELLLQLQELGDSVRVAWPEGAKFKVRQVAGAAQCRVGIRQSKDYFELEGELKLNEGLTLDLQQLLLLMKESTGRFVPLGAGEFLALSAELRKRLDDLAAFSEPHGKGFRFHPLTASVFEEFAGEVGEFSADNKWREQTKRLREAQSFRPVLPTTLQAELRGYQEEGFCWLNRLAHWGVGACLADDMGLGKTVQALAQILSMAAKGPSLVVAPTSVCLNWESEALKFAPTLKVLVFGAGNRELSLKNLKPFDLVVCSYGLLQQESELLAAVSWQAIVLDEAQAIKNMATKRSQAAMELSGAFKMVATGTPIENHLGELWNVFRFINPGLLGSLKQFNVKFAAPIEKDQDKKARGRLKKLIQPFILRRTKNQVLEELPSRTEITIKVEMGEQEAALYEALRRTALETLAGIGKVEGKGEQHLKILAEIMRLRRACCNPRLVLPESTVPSGKLAAFGEILDELRENRHKALVFSQFVGHLDLIREYVEKAGVPYQYLDGSTPARERKKRVDAFQAGEGDLFLISLKAGGVGLNLTAADYVIHMDPWWNPAVEDQASDRAHRIGQQRPVTIYRLVTKGTIEEKIVGLHQQKRGLADSLLEESDMSGKVSAEELLALLRKEA
jgi:superfamily II DNA or RNA helicase